MSNHRENATLHHNAQTNLQTNAQTNAEPFDHQLRRELELSINSVPTMNAPSGRSWADWAPIATGEPIYKDLSYAIVGAVIEVHRHLGPGQLESNYERACQGARVSRHSVSETGRLRVVLQG
jgi:hypothetical protein